MSAFGATDSVGSQLMHRFFSWYAPRFSAYSFALARQNEYEADTIAARLTTAKDTGSALVAVHTFDEHIVGSYWGALFKTADHLPKPHAQPWKKLNEYIQLEKRRDFSAHVETAMSFSSDYSDTHPSLQQRLNNLGVSPEVDTFFNSNAASEWFDTELEVIVEKLDNQWLENTKEDWSERYAYVSSVQDDIQFLESKKPVELSDEQHWNKVTLWCEFKSNDEKQQVLNEYIERKPKSMEARYLRGIHLCEQLNDAGLQDLEIVSTNRDFGIDACSAAYTLLITLHRKDEAERWREIAESVQAENHQLFLDHTELGKKDTLTKAQISAEKRQELVDALQQCKLVKKAWIAEKQVNEKLAENLAIVVSGKLISLHGEAKFIEKVQAALPEFEGWLLYKSGDNKSLAKKIINSGERLV